MVLSCSGIFHGINAYREKTLLDYIRLLKIYRINWELGAYFVKHISLWHVQNLIHIPVYKVRHAYRHRSHVSFLHEILHFPVSSLQVAHTSSWQTHSPRQNDLYNLMCSLSRIGFPFHSRKSMWLKHNTLLNLNYMFLQLCSRFKCTIKWKIYSWNSLQFHHVTIEGLYSRSY